MDYSRKITERLWNMVDKGGLEAVREQDFIDIGNRNRLQGFPA